VSLSRLARDFGTPLYVYSWAAIEENFRRFDAAFSSVPHLVCYATKANSSLAIVKGLARAGSGADVVSGGELRAALECGIPADRIVFSGVGKADEEIRQGVAAGILAFNAESQREIEKIDAIAREHGAVARVALRVNPDIDARSHPYISTGLRRNKFGIDIARAPEIFEGARRLAAVRMTGLQAHIGSQILEAGPLAETARELAALGSALVRRGFSIETLDIGGGIGIGPQGLSPESYAEAVLPFLRGIPFRILIEPGRAIVGPAGALLTRVLYVKKERHKNFVVTDAGMNDFIRPALYQAIHPMEPVAASEGLRFKADVVGPVCETSDSFLTDAEMEEPREGDVLAIRDAGAYGFAMSSNYNFRPRPAEVLVENGTPRLARRRETFDDLKRLERV
jgi:diaminopimelate decarboxylase